MQRQKPLTFEQLDAMFQRNADPEDIYSQLRKLYKATDANSRDTNLLWRLAKACLRRAMNVANDTPENKAQRRAILELGNFYANRALRQNAEHFEALKYKCMLLGQIFDHKQPIKEKAERGLKLQQYLERAARIDPEQHEVLHMQGRLAYSVARLTLFERIAASTLYPKMRPLIKLATFTYAIGKLQQCEQTTRGTSIDNMFYLAKCYQKSDNIPEAKRCLARVIQIPPTNLYERELVRESTLTLAKLNGANVNVRSRG